MKLLAKIESRLLMWHISELLEFSGEFRFLQQSGPKDVGVGGPQPSFF
jgi:hypothetical protein